MRERRSLIARQIIAEYKKEEEYKKTLQRMNSKEKEKNDKKS